MSYVEFLRWQQFYVEEPFDDLHRHFRPAALIACAMSGGDWDDMMGILRNKPVPDLIHDEDALIPSGPQVLEKMIRQFEGDS